MTDHLMKVNEVAEYLGVSRAQVYRLCDSEASPRLLFVQIHGNRRFDPADVRAFIESQKH